MHGVLARTFAAAGTEIDDHLRLHRLDPAYRATFADGSEIRVRADRDAMAAEIEAVRRCGERGRLPPVRRLGDGPVSRGVLLVHRARSPQSAQLWRSIPMDLARLVQLEGFSRLQSRVDDFFTDDRLRRLFSFQALYAGLSPLRALALYAVISYMDCVEGVWFPDGGMHSIAVGLADAATKAGAEFHYDTAVESISAGSPCTVTTQHGRVRRRRRRRQSRSSDRIRTADDRTSHRAGCAAGTTPPVASCG